MSASQNNRTTGFALLTNLSSGIRTENELRRDLHNIAGYLLCKRFHQHQANEVSARWFDIIEAIRAHRTSGSSSASDSQANDESTRPDSESNQRHSPNGSQRRNQNAHGRQSRQGDSQRAHQEAEAERERIRQQRYREQQENLRKQREQEEIQRRRQEQETWEGIWRRYTEDWNNMARMSTVEFDEDVKHSIPWPVKSGRWQDVTPENIKQFMQNAPNGAFWKPVGLRSLLRRETIRWHEDKIRQNFPRIAGDSEALKLTVVVMQVLNNLRQTWMN